jgi:hypothetical protein
MRRTLRPAATALLLSLLGAGAAGAQKATLRLGPMAGPVFGNFHGADISGTSSRTSLAAGAFATFELNRNLALEPQVFFAGKGASVDVGGGTTGTFKLDYIEVPLLIKVLYPLQGGMRVVPNAFVGPAIAFKSTCKLKASGGGVTVEQSCSAANVPIKSTDFLLTFGAGLDVGPVALQVRYDLGLSKIDDTSPPADVKTQAWIVTAGFGIPLGAR